MIFFGLRSAISNLPLLLRGNRSVAISDEPIPLSTQPRPPASISRVRYLDGLRGLAAIQVIIHHYSVGFLNDSNHLGFIGNGNFAVYIFFLMSGYVLTFSFEKDPFGLPRNLSRRLIRLGLPVAAAAVFATCLLSTMYQFGQEAAVVSGSRVLSDYSAFPSLRDVFAEASGLRMLTGFYDTTIFRGIAPYLPILARAVDPPMWTLHIELWGSVLVILLVCFRAKSPSFYPWVVLLTLIGTGVHPLGLFVVGNFVATYFDRIPTRFMNNWLSLIIGSLVFAGGIYLAAAAAPPAIWRLTPLLQYQRISYAVCRPERRNRRGDGIYRDDVYRSYPLCSAMRDSSFGSEGCRSRFISCIFPL